MKHKTTQKLHSKTSIQERTLVLVCIALKLYSETIDFLSFETKKYLFSTYAESHRAGSFLFCSNAIVRQFSLSRMTRREILKE
jgi:hypothetical protein